VGLTSHSYLAASYGQSSLNRVAGETRGRAFFQGMTGFVTFDSYFKPLATELNRQYATARKTEPNSAVSERREGNLAAFFLFKETLI
jgi:hypothetical protein